jgi:ubiquinone/menaquinone biosynthesis C-methylase UbiE
MKKEGNIDRMPNFAFRAMSAVFALLDRFFPRVDRRLAGFDIREGMTVVDYGCGPGRYAIRFARRVGESGKVYAVDVQELALQVVERRARAENLGNITPVLADGYRTSIPDHAADRVFALDMFFMVKDPVALLAEIHRITRRDGVLILDDGHQSRQATINKVSRSGKWTIQDQSRYHLRLTPKW